MRLCAPAFELCREMLSSADHGPRVPGVAREAIGEALGLASGEKDQLLKPNKSQCCYVEHMFSETGELLQSVESTASSALAFERCEATLKKELYRVVTEALSLIKECCGEQWLRAAIIQGSHKELQGLY